ncbi:MAG: hypothetical protein K6E50_07010 [Lachnospiraceae bacterium]|nr:hypothetical protein [Lachnospiraceae bacterium]
MFKELWTGGILLAGSVMDIRRKALPVSYLIFCAIGSVVILILQQADLRELCIGLVPGLVLLLCGKLTSCVGAADAVLMMLLGGMYGIGGGGEQLMYALLLAAIAAIFLIMMHRAGRKSTLPFVPFLLGGFLLYMLRLSLSGA